MRTIAIIGNETSVHTSKSAQEAVAPCLRVKSSTDLRNNYNEISSFCRESREPVFITKNGQCDLVIMSMETFEMLSGKLELYRLHSVWPPRLENLVVGVHFQRFLPYPPSDSTMQSLRLIAKEDGRLTEKELLLVRFVPMWNKSITKRNNPRLGNSIRIIIFCR